MRRVGVQKVDGLGKKIESWRRGEERRFGEKVSCANKEVEVLLSWEIIKFSFILFNLIFAIYGIDGDSDQIYFMVNQISFISPFFHI